MKNRIVITAGGTSERIDNVRKITNSSSGKLGLTIADKLIQLKDDYIEKIYYICAKNSYKPSNEKIEIIEVFDAEDLKVATQKLLSCEKIDYFIHSMAVSDYTVDYVTTAESLALAASDNFLDTMINYNGGFKDSKISSSEDNLIIKLKKTPKIISLIKDISPETYLVGFKLLDGISEDKLLDIGVKLKDKNGCDLVVANDLANIRSGNHKAFIIKKDNSYIKASDKDDIALKLIGEMFQDN